MVDCLHRAMRPASRPVITPLIVDPMMIVTMVGRASVDHHADAPSNRPNAAPSRTPITGVLTVTPRRLEGSKSDPNESSSRPAFKTSPRQRRGKKRCPSEAEPLPTDLAGLRRSLASVIQHGKPERVRAILTI